MRALLGLVHALRTGAPIGPEGERGEAPRLGLPRELVQPRSGAGGQTRQLLVISNRLPDLRHAADDEGGIRKRNVGGLVSALEPALRARGGMWLGWSGRTVPDAEPVENGVIDEGTAQFVWFDYRESWYRDYYSGFCNQTLWPLFHSFPSRVTFADSAWDAYRQVNEDVADLAVTHIASTGLIWAQDYHLLLLGRAMRQRGHTGPIGHFLHIPFPGLDIFSMLPWAAEILDALLDFDLLGFHTPQHVENFRSCVAALLPAKIADDVVHSRGRATHLAAMPIGILPDTFREPPEPSVVEEIEEIEGLTRSIGEGGVRDRRASS